MEFQFDWQAAINSIPYLLKGVPYTLMISFGGLVIGFVLGIIFGLLSINKHWFLRWPATAYIEIFRGTPILVQVLFIFYGLPDLIGGPINPLTAGIAAIALNSGAYISEVVRGGVQSIDKGQTEAGQVLGMTKTQIFFKVTLLQVVKRILAPMGNEVITLVKDTSLANTIANKEIIMMAKEYSAKGLIWPLFSTAIFFLVFVGALTLLFGWAEKKLDYFR